ncbi:CubicO group peptidase, beta-lactamase class C family [Enhydrobacter aerosaccus]|uniref:CubicO group peptidase, beta-lactamase class C family n=1 Tax=Enhydrobacter aerosaccus TaxID=225324 RepID=A0A1T4N8V8_9HYPH|nr:serine hydrolase domain-containing protein [Enhydrobacter aerosaccus]SJZ75278.1 CubicO group peptidase, beta-lactamase class C family [Enhydrobacter aerosaccus]
MSVMIDKLLSDAVKQGDVPGVVAVATDAAGTTYEGGFGKRVLGQSDEMTPDTVVWLASMTKAVTGAAAMQQVERGKLGLDSPAKEVIPYLGEVGVLEGFDADGKPVTRAPRRDITLRHLLTHTAGFSYEIWNADICKYQQVMGVPGITGCENKALTTPLLFDPGERWDYGINIDWAGKMVEAVSGQKLGQYLQHNVLGPLGMDSTAFFISPGMRERLARIHHRGPDGGLTPDLALEIPQEPEFEMGGGGLYGTAGDYLKFVRMMLNQGKSDRGEPVVKPETVAMMSRNAMGDTKVVSLKPAIPPLSNEAEFFPGMDKQWGLSFMINNEEAPTGRSAGSLAWAGLANTYYWIDQKKGVGGVYATQILPFADVKSLPLFHAFEQAVYEA